MDDLVEIVVSSLDELIEKSLKSFAILRAVPFLLVEDTLPPLVALLGISSHGGRSVVLSLRLLKESSPGEEDPEARSACLTSSSNQENISIRDMRSALLELDIVANLDLVVEVMGLELLLLPDPAFVLGVWGKERDLDGHGLVIGGAYNDFMAWIRKKVVESAADAMENMDKEEEVGEFVPLYSSRVNGMECSNSVTHQPTTSSEKRKEKKKAKAANTLVERLTNFAAKLCHVMNKADRRMGYVHDLSAARKASMLCYLNSHCAQIIGSVQLI
ncbi:ribosomal protein S17 [Actinidia rufa]|uniref:Ribosomal protein S17 n=1 Tax=Actinidia rufa TaxID=165716 RepID=A0A7J0GU08_9ERIC|nr:ribosomal protein S17 [Actinidia rufa]